MNYFIVHAHHERNSFNAALTHRAQEALGARGHQVEISDLHQMNFDPVSDRRNFVTVADAQFLKQQREEEYATAHAGFADDVHAEITKMEACDVLVLQFPLWWFGMPAILKGWVDRVFASGRVYGGGHWFDNGHFAGRKAMLSITTAASEEASTRDGLFGDILETLAPINYGMLRFIGFDVLPPFVAWSVTRAEAAVRAQFLDQYVDRLVNVDTTTPIKYPPLSQYDPATLRLTT